jgi:hypothetical protein
MSAGVSIFGGLIRDRGHDCGMIVSDVQSAYAAGKVQILVTVHVNYESPVAFRWIDVVIGI